MSNRPASFLGTASLADPAQRAIIATGQIELIALMQAEWSALRRLAVMQMRAAACDADVAASLGISRQRVLQIGSQVSMARAGQVVATAKRRATEVEGA